jgi:predicted acetyltransferase
VSFEVTPCADLDEFGEAFLAIGQYFGLEPTPERLERFAKNLPVERMHAAREDGVTVGGAGSFPFEATVPGGFASAAGVTVVGTYPTHRRRGVLRALMRAQLDDVHERGEPLAMLWASDERIYGRFGYGMASLVGWPALPREAPFAVEVDQRGRIRTVDTEEALELFPRVWDAVRPRFPGMLARSREWWEYRVLFDPPERREGGGPKRLAVLETDDGPEGYAIYRHKPPKFEEGTPDGEVDAIEVVALDGAPTAQLWRFLLDIDWAVRVTAWLLPVDHQLFHMLAAPREMRFRLTDGLWVRLVDVGAALSARTYEQDGPLVLDVSDAFCPWNQGRWKLEAGQAARTDASADIRCDVSVLGSVYLGAFAMSELVRAGRAEEVTPGAARRADAMFAAERKPWCPEIF